MLKQIALATSILASAQSFAGDTLLCEADVLYNTNGKVGYYTEEVAVHIMDSGIGIISTASASIYTEKSFVSLKKEGTLAADRGDAFFILKPKGKNLFTFGMIYKNSERPAIAGLCRPFVSKQVR